MPVQRLEIKGNIVSEVLWQKCEKLVDFDKPQVIDHELQLFVRHRLGSPSLFLKEDGTIWLLTGAIINGFRVSGPNRVCRALGIQ